MGRDPWTGKQTERLLGDCIRGHSRHMLRNLHLTALRAFEAATRTGSFRLAADDLGLTPSAVSHAIRGLEQDLGTVLFNAKAAASG